MHGGVILLTQGVDGLAEPLTREMLSVLGADSAQDAEAADRTGSAPVISGLPGVSALPVYGRAEGDAPRLFVCGPCVSSLDVAWHLAGAGLLAPWDAVLAHSQRQGRGRGGRCWQSPPGNVHAALLLPHDFLAAGRAAPVLTGVLVHSALRALGVRALLKWPNDLLWAASPLPERKVGGVLLERRNTTILAGVGLNLRHAPEPALLRSGAACPAGTLPLDMRPVPCCKALLAALRAAWEQGRPWGTAGTAAMLASADDSLAWKGRRVAVEHDGQTVHGVLRGLSEEGGLRLETATGDQRILYVGSLRPV